MSDLLNESEWEIAPETSASAAASRTRLLPMKPSPRGEDPPADASDDHAWMHFQEEEFEVTGVEIEPGWSYGKMPPDEADQLVSDITFEITTDDSPALGRSFTRRFYWPKDQSTWYFKMHDELSILNAMHLKGGNDAPPNLLRALKDAFGLRGKGLLQQGFEPKRVKIDDEWVNSETEFKKVQKWNKIL